jgi:hypothetical protein
MVESIRKGRGPREAQAAVIVRRVHRLRPWFLGALYAVALLPMSIAPRHSGNVLSRYMTTEGIVERGTLAIETSPLLARSGSPDIVRFGPHYYSDKPPVLSALAAILYAPLYGAGIRFSGPPEHFVWANLVLVWGVVGVASGLTLVWLRELLQAAPVPPWIADLLTLGFGFTTPLLTYAVTFNNHSVAAALITGGLAFVLLEEPDRAHTRRRQAVAGVLAALAFTIDLPAGGVTLGALGIWLTLRTRSIPLAFMAGALAPLVLHAALQSMVTGTPFPAEMYPEAFAYPGSYWASPEGQWKETGPRWQFGLEFLIGPQGWLTVTPVLAFALIGLVLVLSRRGDPLRPMAMAVIGMVAVLLIYYIWFTRRTDIAGHSFGTRHLLAVTPACYVFAVVGLARLRSRFAAILFVLLMFVGGVYAVAGMRDPWSRIEIRAPKEPALGVLQRFVLYPWSSYSR